MAKITIYGISWDDTVQEAKVVSVKYRLTSDVDSPENYQIVSTNTLVDIDGSFFIPVVIDGLDLALSYTVRITSSCGGLFQDEIFGPGETEFSGFSLGFSEGFNS